MLDTPLNCVVRTHYISTLGFTKIPHQLIVSSTSFYSHITHNNKAGRAWHWLLLFRPHFIKTNTLHTLTLLLCHRFVSMCDSSTFAMALFLPLHFSILYVGMTHCLSLSLSLSNLRIELLIRTWVVSVESKHPMMFFFFSKFCNIYNSFSFTFTFTSTSTFKRWIFGSIMVTTHVSLSLPHLVYDTNNSCWSLNWS